MVCTDNCFALFFLNEAIIEEVKAQCKEENPKLHQSGTTLIIQLNGYVLLSLEFVIEVLC